MHRELCWPESVSSSCASQRFLPDTSPNSILHSLNAVFPPGTCHAYAIFWRPVSDSVGERAERIWTGGARLPACRVRRRLRPNGPLPGGSAGCFGCRPSECFVVLVLNPVLSGLE